MFGTEILEKIKVNNELRKTYPNSIMFQCYKNAGSILTLRDHELKRKKVRKNYFEFKSITI